MEEYIEVNLGYIYDILGYMIEAEYWDDEIVPEDYLGFIEDYQERIESQRSDKSAEKFRQGLRAVLKAILNKPNTVKIVELYYTKTSFLYISVVLD